MPIVVRGLLPVVLATLLLAATASGAAAVSRGLPTQSLGNRGADTRAIQGLLVHRGFPVPIDGVFAATTKDRVKAFQASRGLPVTGVVGDTTWAKLLVSLAPGSRGEAVKVLQRQLNDKRRAGLPVDGLYGTSTKAAVSTFQKHIGMTPHGLVGPVTWRNLLWHYDYPAFDSTSLCDYSVGNGRANWGTGAAIGQLEAAARVFATAGRGRVAVGDIGHEHGGDLAGHTTHEVGLDVDIRPIRDGRNQCTNGTNWRYASYDRGATRTLIKAIRGAAPGHVKLIYFNDPVLIREGLTTWFSGHDNHLHVRYCEVSHPVAKYRC
jgi:peptidoglycan hydrolase-like protein with peptidoglycan-binding domain